nr:hypothetical protein [Kibdelosporangium sp. MJ126-NF4]CEL13912.1 hypothetical protein [Kibdelosporangium sp. MJ126-NF4]
MPGEGEVLALPAGPRVDRFVAACRAARDSRPVALVCQTLALASAVPTGLIRIRRSVYPAGSCGWRGRSSTVT